MKIPRHEWPLMQIINGKNKSSRLRHCIIIEHYNYHDVSKISILEGKGIWMVVIVERKAASPYLGMVLKGWWINRLWSNQDIAYLY